MEGVPLQGLVEGPLVLSQKGLGRSGLIRSIESVFQRFHLCASLFVQSSGFIELVSSLFLMSSLFFVVLRLRKVLISARLPQASA